MTAERVIEDEEIIALEEQRDYLLKSLDDLENEHAAGDIDEGDYTELKDDYTARAAVMIRTIEAGKARVGEASSGGGRRFAWIAGIATVAILAGVFIGQASGSRRAGEFGSGEIRAGSRTLLLQADDALQNQRFDEAIELYDEVLETEPTNVQAITYRAWVRYRQDPVAGLALPDFEDAIALEPDYTDARVFNTIVLLEDDQALEASVQLKAFDATDPPPFMLSLVESRLLRENVMLALFGAEQPVPIGDTAFDVDDVVAVARSSVDRRREFAEAQILFDAALTHDPSHVEAHAYAGWMLARLWDDPQIGAGMSDDEAAEMQASATTFLDTAIDLDPTYPDALVFRSFLRRAQDDIEGSAADLTTYYALDDDQADLLLYISDGGLDEVLE